jgi:alkanesulfonate monooxygenase SsuD/methylene tetrahydromethanopterin reductase-like flavin-dependent oxidoreductase (luciferase family)
MRIGLLLPMASTDAGRILSSASRAEALGFDGLFAFDHFFPPGAPSDRPSFESYSTLAAVASITERVTLGTLVTRASLRPLGILAKQAVGLDDVAAGRFVLAIGTGDAISRAEHVAFGLPYLGPDVRRAHLVETVRGLRALLRGEAWGGGEHVPAAPGPLLPMPRTPGGPPIWIGGTSEGAVRAAAVLGDGWNAWAIAPEAFAERVALLEATRGDRRVEPTWGGAVVVGRDRDEAERLAAARRERGVRDDSFVGAPDEAVAWLRRFEQAGATWCILLPAGGDDRIGLIAERVLPSFGGARAA